MTHKKKKAKDKMLKALTDEAARVIDKGDSLVVVGIDPRNLKLLEEHADILGVDVADLMLIGAATICMTIKMLYHARCERASSWTPNSAIAA